jgi:hypothetical protein
VERPKATKPEPGAEQSILSSVQAEFFERWIGELQKTATIKSSLPVKAVADAGFGG